MPRLPQPGKDNGQWGDILNDYLEKSHDEAGDLKMNTVGAVQIKAQSITASKIAPGVISSVGLSGSYQDLTSVPLIPETADDLGAEPAGLSNTTKELLSTEFVTVDENGQLTIGGDAVPIEAGLDDAGVATLVSSVGSETGRATTGKFSRAGTLRRWKSKLGLNPASAKIVFLGDSTSVESIMAEMYVRLRTIHTKVGMPLSGMVSANIIAGGNNGAALSSWLADAAGPNSSTYSLSKLISDQPDLVVMCFGLNDIRLGATSIAQMTERLIAAVELITVNCPEVDILLRMPNTTQTTVVGTSFVSGITHQELSDRLRAVYLSLTDRWPHVVIADVQADVFGTVAQVVNPLLQDELHPNIPGQRALAEYLTQSYIGRDQQRTSLVPRAYRYERTGVVAGGGAGYIDVNSVTGNVTTPPGSEWVLTAADSIYIEDFGTLSLATATSFAAQGTGQRISIPGTYSGMAGRLLTAYGSHAAEGVAGGRYFATINPDAIPAGATLDLPVIITGATREMGVIVQPPSSTFALGLMISGAVTADNTVTVRLFNPTAATVDPASSAQWRFWLAR